MEFDNFKILIFFLGISFIIFFLSGFIIILLYKHQNKYLLNLQNINKIQADHSFAVLNSKIEIQEETFNFISKEVHDNVGLQLTLAKRSLAEFLVDDTLCNHRLSTVYDLLTNVITDLGNLSRSLSTEYITQNGLLAAIRREISIINRSEKLQVNFEVQGEEKYFESNKELILFRMIQESINNAIKHSRSPSLNLVINYLPHSVQVKIVDFGKGFDYTEGNTLNSGLSNLVTRAKVLNGNCHISSTANIGTTINILIPN